MTSKYFLIFQFLIVGGSIFSSGIVESATIIIPNNNNARTRKDNIDERGAAGEYFEGDIVLTPATKAGIVGQNFRWPGAKVIYQLAPGFTSAETAVIASAMAEISSKTCITFAVRTNEPSYVYVTRANSGCWSNIGRIGGRQTLNLQPGNPGCIFKGTIAHELIHAIGFYHEQSRTDRDDFLTINWSNIQKGTEGNFAKYSSARINPQGVGYDYGSIMHYSKYAFANDYRVPTIVTKDPNTVIGQRRGLSAKDAQKIKNMYGCA